MENPDPKELHKIDDLERDLYSREFKGDLTPRASAPTTPVDVGTEWNHNAISPDVSQEPILQPQPIVPKPVVGSVVKKIFIVSALFFILSAGVAAFVFFGGLNLISSNKVELEFVGPVSVAAGEELAFDVVIKNQNSTSLVNSTIYIDYPDGTKQAVDITQDMLHSKEGIEEIAAKTTVQRTIRSVLFGQERAMKEIKVTFEYGLKNSNGIFKKEKTYTVSISSTPLTMNISHPTEASSGQDIAFSIEVVSNSTVPLTNLLITADYPRGFVFKSADPEPLDTKLWSIPILKPGEKKVITLRGTLQGEENDEGVFSFNIGIKNALNTKIIATNFLSSIESIKVRRPPLAATLSLDDAGRNERIITPGQSVTGSITLRNNMTVPLINVEPSLTFKGEPLDTTSPRGSGLYRLPTQTITWDKTLVDSLAQIDPGGSVMLQFSFSALSQQMLANLKNGQINLTFNAVATPSGGSQIISTTASAKAKVQSYVNAYPQISYSGGPFQNSGPIEPKAETKTTYTITWTTTRSSNDIGNAEMHGSIPSYVKWLNVKSPANEDLTFIPERNEVIWRIGTIPGGIAGSVAREVSFQVEIFPSFNQIGSRPIVMDNIWFKGTDTFTQNVLTINGVSLSTLGSVTQ